MKNAYKTHFSIFDLAESQMRGAKPGLAKYERSICELAAQEFPDCKARAGVPLPTPGMVRDLEVGIPTAGGNLAVSSLLATAQAARPRLVFDELNVRRVELRSVAEVSLPTFTGDPTNVWIADEGGASTSFSGLAVKTMQLTPKQAASRVAYSRRLAAGSPDRRTLEASITAELQRAVRTVQEQGLLIGTGSQGQPLGLINTPGVSSKTFASALPTHSELVDMVEALADADHDLSAAAFVMHPSDMAGLLKTQVTSGGGDTVVSFSGGRYRVAGLPVVATRNLTEGKVLLADWSRYVIGDFGPNMLLVDPYSGSKSITGQVELHLISFIDGGLSEADAVVVGSM